MTYDTKRRAKPLTTLASASDLKRVWFSVKGQMTKQELAQRLNLRRRSTLTQLMNASNPRLKISRKLTRALREFENGGKSAEVIASIFIPVGTLLPPTAEVFVCRGCGENSIRMNRRRLYHSDNCGQNYRRASPRN